MALIGIMRPIFFTQNSMIRKFFTNHRANGAFSRTVCFRHRVKANRVFIINFVKLTKPW